jgi:uncharacterized protein
MAAEDFRQLQYAFAAHIRAPQDAPAPPDVEDRRMAVYRELFYNNVESFLANSFPVLRKLLDDSAWHALARDFFARHRCRSPLFLEIPQEFLDYLERERGARPEDPAFLQELAHYEWIELALSVAEAGEPPPADPQGELLEHPAVLSELAWPLCYRYPVHRIGPRFQPREPGEQPTWLLVYRDAKDEVGFLELNAVSARLYALLQEDAGRSGRDALALIAEELQHPQPAAVMEGGRDMLEQWRRLGIVLGTRPS